MQEEVTQKTIALVIKAAKLDANILKSAMRMYLNHCRKQAQKTHGKVSVKELVGEGESVLEDVTFTADNRMILQYAKDNCNQLYVYDTDGNRLSEIDHRATEVSGIFQGQGCRCCGTGI